MDISEEQKKILEMLTSEYLTPAQIAERRQKSIQSVYKIINKLKKKGLLTGGLIGGFNLGGVEKLKNNKNSTCASHGNKNLLRLHNIQESIKLLSKSDKYLRLLKESNKYEIDSITVMLHEDSLDLYTQTGLSFTGYTTDECYLKAITYLKQVYGKIENDLGVSIDKVRYSNKKWVRQHIAECNSEVAKDANEKQERIIVTAKEDGKQAIITDNSFNLNELEAVHPKTAKKDMDQVVKQLSDWRENNPPTNSELLKYLTEVAKNQDVYNENIKLHLGVLTKMGETMQDMRNLMKSNKQEAMRFLSQPSRPQHSSQLSLLQYTGGYE